MHNSIIQKKSVNTGYLSLNIKLINSMLSYIDLIIVRGLPGSGKSTLAKTFTDRVHYEADMYHIVDGVYSYDSSKNHLAHRWCLDSVYAALYSDQGVVVSNTFTEVVEISPYIEVVKSFNKTYKILRCNNLYGSIHNVPQETITRMKNRFENIDGEISIG